MAALQTALVREQFDQQVAHYLASSAMADRMVIEAIVAAAPVQPGQRVLDVACGAGFLLLAYRDAGADVFGVDLSSAMLREAANQSPHRRLAHFEGENGRRRDRVLSGRRKAGLGQRRDDYESGQGRAVEQVRCAKPL
jgi:2-polyprenyl-3-methyl-5-hydroxy-6-metoxy-1,4-benzoquinol methylase